MKKELNVLIIDDNEDDLDFFSELLTEHATKAKYTVYTADSADDGLELFKKQEIDCCFIDFNMPEKDGVQMLEEIKKLSSKHCAIVILTGEPHQRIQAEAARKGALDYIVKDSHTSAEQLEEVIGKVLNWADDLNVSSSNTADNDAATSNE